MERLEEVKIETRRQKIFEKYFYFRMFYGRANSYFSLPINIMQFVILITLYIKLYLKFTIDWVIYVTLAVFFIIFMLVGYLDYKYQIVNEETSFNNRFNPEIQYIKNRAEGKK